MSAQKNVLGLIYSGRQERRPADIRVNALHKAAMGLVNFRRGGSRLKTKDLVGFLLGHGARSWRLSQPAASIRVRVLTPDGKAAVKIGLQ